MTRYSRIIFTVLMVFSLVSCGRKNIIEPTESDAVKNDLMVDETINTTQTAASEKKEQQSVIIPEEEEQQEMEPLNDSPENDEAFVLATEYIPNVFIDLKYASEDNFTGVVIYGFDSAYLRYGTAKKLSAVSEEIARDGYALKIWDAYRPVAAQFKLWEICPNSKYVANPNKGFSSHSRGNTVDITLVKLDGGDIDMPTGFDDFSLKADRDYSDCTETEAENALYLEKIMIEKGFKAYQGEWWHYTDMDDYPVEQDFIPD